MNFDQAKKYAQRFDNEHRQAATKLREIGERLARELGIEARGPMGLTPDAIKFSSEYQKAWKQERQAFSAMREFNTQYTRVFKRELREERNAKRAASAQR